MSNNKPNLKYELVNPNDLNLLDEEERKCLEMRLGICRYDRPHTIKEISEDMKFSHPQGAKKLEIKALKKLKAHRCKINYKMR